MEKKAKRPTGIELTSSRSQGQCSTAALQPWPLNLRSLLEAVTDGPVAQPVEQVDHLLKVVIRVLQILLHLESDVVGHVVGVEVDDRRDEVVPHDHLR